MTVALEDISPGHYEIAATWLADPAVNRWMYSEWRERRPDARTVALVAQNPRNRIWLIKVRDEPYGLCSIGAISKIDRTGVAWYLRAPNQTRLPGAMAEAVRRMTEAGFQTIGLHSISASILEPNVGSRRVLENAGYRYAGRLREAFAFQNSFVDRLHFDCVRSDILSGP